MRTIGHRAPPRISTQASGRLLGEGALFNDEIHRLPTGTRSFIQKGFHRFRTLDEARQIKDALRAQGIADVTRKRALHALGGDLGETTTLYGDESQPATIDHLRALMGVLNAHDVSYLLIGGFGFFAHGYHRATTDVDLLLPKRSPVFKHINSAMRMLFGHVVDVLEERTQAESVWVADTFVVDLMFSANGQTYDQLLPHRQVIDLDGIPVSTLGLEGLLLTHKNT